MRVARCRVPADLIKDGANSLAMVSAEGLAQQLAHGAILLLGKGFGGRSHLRRHGDGKDAGAAWIRGHAYIVGQCNEICYDRQQKTDRFRVEASNFEALNYTIVLI